MKAKSERRRPFIGDQIEECRDASGLFYILCFQRGYLVNWDVQVGVFLKCSLFWYCRHFQWRKFMFSFSKFHRKPFGIMRLVKVVRLLISQDQPS